MDAFRKRAYGRLFALAIICAAFAAMVAHNALRPSASEADRPQAVSDFVVGVRSADLGESDRERYRRQWDSFTTEARQQILNEMVRDHLKRIRAQTKDLPPSERALRIRREVNRMRDEHRAAPTEDKRRIRERLNSPESKQMVANAIKVYLKEFTARERAEMDPLVRECLYQLEQLAVE